MKTVQSRKGVAVMEINVGYSIMLVAVTAIVTFILRAIPFVVFGGKKDMHPTVRMIADKLPPAIIAVLVVYCVKSDIAMPGTGTIATLIALAAVVLVHLWKKNTLLSIAVGTVIYMILIRVIV